MKTINLHVDLTEADYILFNEDAFLTSKAGKKSMLLFRITPWIVSLILIGALYAISDEQYFVIVMALILFVVSGIMNVKAKNIMQKTIIRSVNDMKSQGKLPYDVSSDLSFEEDIIRSKSAEGEHSYTYESIERIKEVPSALYIYFDAARGIIIPKRCLKNDKELRSIIERLENGRKTQE
ncbi:MAG: YcxB family protein [Clostridia bacterium]|nr:YcxB family protein [Clostridia bacterium]